MNEVLEQLSSGVRAKSVDAGALLDMRRKVFAEKDSVEHAWRKASEWTGSRESQGMYLYLIGAHERAVRVLEQEAASEPARLMFGLALVELNQPEKALVALKGLKSFEAKLGRARANMLLGNVDEADKAVKELEGSDKKHPEVRLARAEFCFRNGNMEDAISLVEGVLKEDAQHSRALFLGALVADRCGEDDVAIARYEALAQARPVHVDALMNLGILYEDRNDFRQAVRCYETVLREHPNHMRAKLYLKDASASINMYYDEDRERREDKRLQVLRTPISDFELSVRSRNCLQKMKIETLADLILRTEAELLAYKNFGETSLQEIKAILASRGLRLGMQRDEALKTTAIDEALEDSGRKHEGILAESIDTLELSVRARKCMERLGVSTIGDLCVHSEQTLMAAPNFGATSLIEVKRKLSELGLSLKA